MPIDLEAVWDKVTNAATAVGEGVARGLTRLLGSSNERQVRKMLGTVQQFNELGAKLRELSDEQLKELTTDFRRRLAVCRHRS